MQNSNSALHMEYLTKTTKSIFFLSFTLLVYGYVCRIFNLYFFWESKTLCWVSFFIALICFLSNRIRFKKLQQRRTVSERIGIAILVFILFVQSMLFIIIPKSEAFYTARQYLLKSKEMEKEVGELNSLFSMPAGTISTTSTAQGYAGETELNLTLKGSKKYKDITIRLTKEVTSNWIVNQVQ